ncbi:hypothetical protein TNCV_725681 [Trichonephila clavipes]|nr:hypothetical protein TNCV_725681 [Trichonephila clavipes]
MGNIIHGRSQKAAGAAVAQCHPIFPRIASLPFRAFFPQPSLPQNLSTPVSVRLRPISRIPDYRSLVRFSNLAVVVEWSGTRSRCCFCQVVDLSLDASKGLLYIRADALQICRGSNASYSWPACHEFEPHVAEDPPCIGGRYTLNMSRVKRSPVGVVWNLGGGRLSAQVSSSLLDYGSKLRGSSSKALV